jgi:transposase
MIGLPTGMQIWIVAGVTDMRRGFVGLSGMVQTALEQSPFSGQVFVFRGKRGDLIKLLWWPRVAPCRSHPRSSRCCWKASTGGDQYAVTHRRWRCEQNNFYFPAHFHFAVMKVC